MITGKSTHSEQVNLPDTAEQYFELLRAERNKITHDNELIDPQTRCMAENIYHEARNESTAGMVAVGNVTLNRVESDYFPNTICDVVHEGPHYESWKTKKFQDLPDDLRVYYPKKNRCQFSWYCDGLSDTIHNKRKFQQILELSVDIRKKVYPDITDGATHYHADYVHPRWADVYKHTVTIDTHIFYRHDRD